MKRKLILCICVIFNIGFTANAQSYCDFIKKVREYQNSVKLNEHLEAEYQIPEVDTTSFDINIYMSFFDKLTLKSGNKMFLVNIYGLYEGRPTLCVQDTAFNMDKFVDEITTKYNQDIDSFVDQKKAKYISENYPEDKINRLDKFRENQKKSFTRNSALIQYALDSSKRICNNLIPEDTPEGYLQYLFFNQMGEQFALFWHTLNLEKTVLCDNQDAEFFATYFENRKEYFKYSKKEFDELLLTDLLPLIELDSTYCKITWYEIHTHKGIFKKTYSIERKNPFNVKVIYKENIATISKTFFY